MTVIDTLKSVFLPNRDDVRPPSPGYEPVDTGSEQVEFPHSRRPKSDDRGVYWCFWALGAGVLLSWNVLICTLPLLQSFFAEESSTRATLASWLSTTYCFGNLFFLGIAQRNVGKGSPSPLLHNALLLLLLTSLLLTFPFLPLVLPTLSSTSPFLLPLMILFTVLLSIATAWLQSAVFALSALWGSRETLAVMSGQGGTGVLVSLTQVTLAVASALTTSGDTGSANPSTLAGVGLWALCSIGAFGCMAAHRWLVKHPDYALALGPVLARQEHRMESSGILKVGENVTNSVFKKNIALEMAVAWDFVVTLSVFPPITTAVLSVQDTPQRLLQPSVFIPIHFLVFNVGDYAGRTYLPSMAPVTSHPRIILMSIFRTVFIPIFLACNVTPRTSSPLINSDTAYFLILLLFGLTNGYISSLSMIVASTPEMNPRISHDEKDVAGTLAAFCLVAGLAGGSLLSFGVNWLVRGNPFG